MAVRTDALEGVINDQAWFHYDMAGDVLYLRNTADRDTPALGEETDDGLIVLRAEADGRVVGLTVINWWLRFGAGPRPTSLHDLEATVAPWGDRLAA